MNGWRADWLLVVVAALLMGGCTMAPGPAGGASPLTLPRVDAEATPAEDEAQPEPELQATGSVSVTGLPSDLLNAVLDDASQRTGVAPEALIVTQAEAMTWNDGSLGCPEPGMFYTQALVDGYWIIIDADGQMLDYRVQSSGALRVCEQGLRRGGNRP